MFSYANYQIIFFFFKEEDGIRDVAVTGVQTCALPISRPRTASLAPTAGTLFSALHAITQAWQPVHRSRSITIPQSAISRLPHTDPGGVEEAEAPEGIDLVGNQVVWVGTFPAEERNVDHVRARPGVELGLELGPPLGRLHPDPIPVLHPQPGRRVWMDLYPLLPGCPNVDRRLLQEPGLVCPASGGPAHQAVRVETEGERAWLPG